MTWTWFSTIYGEILQKLYHIIDDSDSDFQTQKSVILKSSSRNPFVPLNYKGISLLSCVGKVFSGIINVRVVNFCEENGIYEDEQNGFSKHRSCEDHIFVLTSITKNRMSEGRDTFCAFIDM